MGTTEQPEQPLPGLRCGWAGCPVELPDEKEWLIHVAVHVFTLKPGETTPWLGPPELDPDRRRVDGMFFEEFHGICQETLGYLSYPVDDRSDGEEEDDDRAFSQINALSSPASTPPQVGLPESPDFAEKVNGPSVSMAATVEPLRLIRSPSRSPREPERVLSHRTSGSADDVEAELLPTSPSPSINASQNTNSNQEDTQSPHSLSHGLPMQTQSQFPMPNVNRFRRGTFQIPSLRQQHLPSGFGMSQSQSPPLRPLGSSQASAPSSQSQTNGNGMSCMYTQAFRPPETQDSYESD